MSRNIQDQGNFGDFNPQDLGQMLFTESFLPLAGSDSIIRLSQTDLHSSQFKMLYQKENPLVGNVCHEVTSAINFGAIEECSIGLEDQPPENAEEDDVERQLVVDEDNGIHQENMSQKFLQTSLGQVSDHADYTSELDNSVLDVMQLINHDDSEVPNFVVIPSEKEKNPPYLIKPEYSHITTKNNEPIKFSLKGAKPGQIVEVKFQYTEEKYKEIPVVACKLHEGKDDGFLFSVSAARKKVEQRKTRINDHPTVDFSLRAENISNIGEFDFFITMWCLNSCHKGNGKKMQLILNLFEDTKLVQEKRFLVRACKNVKRDFKDAFVEGECRPEVLPDPDSFLTRSPPEPVVPNNDLPVEESSTCMSDDTDLPMSLPPCNNPSSSLIPTPVKKRRNNIGWTSTKPKQEDDEFKAFAIDVGLQLKKMDKFQAIIARKLINDALFMGALKKLDLEFRITRAPI